MAKMPVQLQAVYDDVARTVTISGMGAPPKGPAEIPADLWYGQTGPGFEFVVNVQPKNVTAVPTAIYIVPNSNPIERRLVEYRDGAWQLPGTVIPG